LTAGDEEREEGGQLDDSGGQRMKAEGGRRMKEKDKWRSERDGCEEGGWKIGGKD